MSCSSCFESGEVAIAYNILSVDLTHVVVFISYFYVINSYRWGKPIRLLEVAIAAAAADFEESATTTTHGTIHCNHTSTTGDESVDFD